MEQTLMAHGAAFLVLIVGLVAAVALVVVGRQRERHARLKRRFGSEYERVVAATGSRPRAEAELEARERHVRDYHLHPLSADESAQYQTAWRRLQARFVDEPAATVTEADALVADVMRKRGYPDEAFDVRANDLSVDHAEAVEHYREAHRLAAAQSQAGQPSSTELLRQALVHYRVLFEDLLGGAQTHRGEPA